MKSNTRKTILDIVHRGNASHIASSYSLVEILRAIYRVVDINKIIDGEKDRDRIVVSKGHSASAVYSILHEFGLMTKESLCSYHMNGSLLSGHVSHFIKYVEHSTGALGHGLPVAVGICIGLKAAGMEETKIYVIIGDGELNEGSNWEAMMLAGHRKLDNLYVLLDNNRFGGISKTDDCCSLSPCKERFEAFGFNAFEVDGHNEEMIFDILKASINAQKPTAILCDTIKGKGISFMENDNVWHYRPPDKEAYTECLKELEKEK